MERKSWPWRKKSEKITGETESSGSVSSVSLSERLSDEQEIIRLSQSPVASLKNEAQFSELSPKNNSDENKDQTAKILGEKLSSAISDLNAKEALVKQHSTVAEEAVLGWEKAEQENISLKAQLNSSNQKNVILEEKIGHLDGALKECVRELRQVRSERERKVQDSLFQQSRKWESEKTNLELQVTELRAKLEAKAENTYTKTAPQNQEFNSRISSLEMEISSLKSQLHVRTLEREMSIKSAETASKQRLETLKRTNKLEQECRKLRAKLKITNLPSQRFSSRGSNYAESATDSDNETSCSDSWSAHLMLELDQFKRSEKSLSVAKSVSSNIDVALLDDFTEMERILTGEDVNQNQDLKFKLEIMERKLIELQKNLNSVNGEKHEIKREFENLEVKKGELEFQLERAKLEIKELKSERRETEFQIQNVRSENSKFRERIKLIQKELDNEKALSAQFKGKIQKAELLENEKRKLESQVLAVRREASTWREKVVSLDESLERERTLAKELKSKLEETEFVRVENRDLKSRISASKEEIGVLRENVSSLQKRSTEIEAGLREKVGLLEKCLEREKVVYNELLMKYQNVEMEFLKNDELVVKIVSLERKIEDERNVSLVYKEGLEASEMKRDKLFLRYEIVCKETEELKLKIEILENEVLKEREIAKGLSCKCKELKDELNLIKDGYCVKEPVISEDFKEKQEQERAKAAGKLAECQQTIDSISQQLKSLANLDDLGLEIENNEINKEMNLNSLQPSIYSDKLAV
ncbi:hypothetical protein LUZ60_001690 [Juncus effusus]|nr:hypothetical protein LUZ60_001690 [Juncus effusus]